MGPLPFSLRLRLAGRHKQTTSLTRILRRLNMGAAGSVAICEMQKENEICARDLFSELMVKWIADRLKLGTPEYPSHLLYLRRKSDDNMTISRTDPFSQKENEICVRDLFSELMVKWIADRLKLGTPECPSHLLHLWPKAKGR